MDGRLEVRVASVDPPDRPQLRRRVEHPHRRRAISPARQLQDVVVDIGQAADDLPQLADAGELVPLAVAGQPPPQPPVRHRPAPDEAVEVVAPVPHRGIRSLE
jgi:hypothetical protein